MLMNDDEQRYSPKQKDTMGAYAKLMVRCWGQFPEDRPSFAECLTVLEDLSRKVFNEAHSTAH